MKLLVRNDPQAQGNARAVGSQPSYEVPNGTITWITIIYLVVNILATSVSNYLSNKPQREIDNKALELKVQDFKVELLQRVLEIDDARERRASIQLLIAAGLLGDSKDQFQKFIDDTTKVIAKWPKRPLKSLTGSLQGTNGTVQNPAVKDTITENSTGAKTPSPVKNAQRPIKTK